MDLKKIVNTNVEDYYLLPPPKEIQKVLPVSEKGLELTQRIDQLYRNNAAELEREVVSQDQLMAANQVLSALERYWSNYITYSR